jgi:hypothetical protein
MRRLLAVLSLAAAVAVGTVVLGQAAGFDLDTRTFGAGTLTSAPCDHDGVNVDYTLAWADRITVQRLTISRIDGACAGLTLDVDLTVDGATVRLPSMVVPPPGSGGSAVTLTVPAGVAASRLQSISITIK